MARRVSPYGRQYTRQRELLLRGNPRCAICGERPATEADHVPPLSQHDHREGSGCCRLQPACWICQRRQAADLAHYKLGRRSRFIPRRPPEPSRQW